MIAVLADDLSGAAEIAGTALGQGLSAEVQTGAPFPTAPADVIVCDTDSRLSPLAVGRAAERAAALVAARPRWMYKKIDSVLRGQVLAEIRAVLGVTGHRRALLVPANPGRRRVVRGGRYFIADVPLDRTAFGHDPHHPARTSDVRQLLGADAAGDVHLVARDAPLPREGILVPDAETAADLAHWAAVLDEETLPVGAVEFFGAALAHHEGHGGRGEVPPQCLDEPSPERPWLFVCGSAAAWERVRGEPPSGSRLPVLAMPAAVIPGGAAASGRWADQAVSALRGQGAAMLAIGDPGVPEASPATLTGRLAEVVVEVLRVCTPARVCIEGGATASAVLGRLGLARLRTCEPIHGGVVGLRPADRAGPLLSLKPGSYPWPAPFWDRFGQG